MKTDLRLSISNVNIKVTKKDKDGNIISEKVVEDTKPKPIKKSK